MLTLGARSYVTTLLLAITGSAKVATPAHLKNLKIVITVQRPRYHLRILLCLTPNDFTLTPDDLTRQ